MPSEPFASEQRSSELPTPGRSVAGVDGCRAGWVMVRRDAAGRFAAPLVVAALDDLPETDMVVIDIPIGLPESGRRACDLEARALLGPRRSSVFTGVRRPFAGHEQLRRGQRLGQAGRRRADQADVEHPTKDPHRR